DHRANHPAFVHQIEGVIDFFQRQLRTDHFIYLDFTGQITLDIAGQLRTAFHAAKRRATPDASGDELERTRADFLAGTGDTDDDRFTPSLVTAFERRS